MGSRKKRPVVFSPTVFPVYKPKGPTSFSVVSHFKRNLPDGYGKIGHFGTLDPFAEGLLLIGIAGAQKLNDFVHELLPKTYRAVGILGERRLGADHLGEVIESQTPKSAHFKIELWQNALEKMLGDYWQAPPAFSAAKFEGKALYEYARQGEFIEKPAVLRKIHQARVQQLFIDEQGRYCVDFEATVSSGTYIRTLFEDLARQLEEVGHLETLHRTAIGHLCSEQALVEDQWPRKGEEFDVFEKGLSVPEVLALDAIHLDEEQALKYGHGVSLSLTSLHINPHAASCKTDLFWVYDQQERLLGLAYAKDGQLLIHFNLTVSTT